MPRSKKKSYEMSDREKRHKIRLGRETRRSLMMVCEEDELSPAQVAAYTRAKKKYDVAQAEISEARRNGWIVSDSICPAAPAQADEDDDVIIINDDEVEEIHNSGRPKRKASAKVGALVKRLAGGVNEKEKQKINGREKRKPLNNSSQLTITNVTGSIDLTGDDDDDDDDDQLSSSKASSVLRANQRPAPGKHPTGSLILAHKLGTNTRVLIPKEHFEKLLPGQFTFIKTINAKPTSAHKQPPASLPAGTQTTSASRKRSTEASADTPSKKKPREPQQEPDGGRLIPLDEYYYCRCEGDSTYREVKGKFKFKCWYCHKIVYNNIKLISHMQGHIESERLQNLDLTDLTHCKHCYKQFETPYEMQCHVEKVHQSNSNVLVCRICEKDHSSQNTLLSHMKMAHAACDMPYVCQLCDFRSSIYGDAVEHFKKRHDSSENIMCYYCLKIFKIHFTASGWGQTQHFFKHLQMHQVKLRTKKCGQCKLTFLQSNSDEAKAHRRKDHVSNIKGIDVVMSRLLKKTVNERRECVMIPVADPLAATAQVKTVNMPAVAKVQELRGVRFSKIPENHTCLECNTPMGTYDHYKKYFECLLCRFRSTCHLSYSNHLKAYHSGHVRLRKVVTRPEKRLKTPLFCLCGCECSFGNAMAYHLVSCSKRTAYVNIPEAKFFEYDDEQEDSNSFEPDVEGPEGPDSTVPTMLTALGLMKRSAKSSSRSSSTSVVRRSVVDVTKYPGTDPVVSPSKPRMKLLQPQHKRSSLLSSLPIKVPFTPQDEEESSQVEEEKSSIDASSDAISGSSEEKKGAMPSDIKDEISEAKVEGGGASISEGDHIEKSSGVQSSENSSVEEINSIAEKDHVTHKPDNNKFIRRPDNGNDEDGKLDNRKSEKEIVQQLHNSETDSFTNHSDNCNLKKNTFSEKQGNTEKGSESKIPDTSEETQSQPQENLEQNSGAMCNEKIGILQEWSKADAVSISVAKDGKCNAGSLTVSGVSETEHSFINEVDKGDGTVKKSKTDSVTNNPNSDCETEV